MGTRQLAPLLIKQPSRLTPLSEGYVRTLKATISHRAKISLPLILVIVLNLPLSLSLSLSLFLHPVDETGNPQDGSLDMLFRGSLKKPQHEFGRVTDSTAQLTFIRSLRGYKGLARELSRVDVFSYGFAFSTSSPERIYHAW